MAVVIFVYTVTLLVMGVVDIVLVLVGNVLDVKKKNTNNGMIEMKACKLCDENGKIKERGLCADCSDYSDEQIIKFKLAEEIQKAEEDVRYKKKGVFEAAWMGNNK